MKPRPYIPRRQAHISLLCNDEPAALDKVPPQRAVVHSRAGVFFRLLLLLLLAAAAEVDFVADVVGDGVDRVRRLAEHHAGESVEGFVCRRC